MQVNDTVRAVHTAGTIRRAFFATVLSVYPKIPGDVGTNGEPTLTLGFLDPTQLHLIGGIEFHKAFRRQTTVRHVSHDEVRQAATEYCWTDVLPNDGGIIVISSLNMDDLNEAPAQPSEPEDTIGTIVHINHSNGLEVNHVYEGLFTVVTSEGEEKELHKFSDLFSAQVFVDAQPPTPMTDDEADAFTAQKIALAGTFLGGSDERIEGSPRDLLGHQLFGENSEEVARGRYMIHLKEQADVAAAAQQEAAATSVTVVATATDPSAADLDAVAAEDQAKQDTSGTTEAAQ